MWTKLPIEIQDKIFLYLDSWTLEKLRPLQSDYVKSITKYNTLYKAAQYGTIENIKWLYSQGDQLEIGVFNKAALSGDLEKIEWLLENDCPYNKELFASAAISGNIKIMDFLYDLDFPYDERVFINACKSYDNRVHLLDWLEEREFPRNNHILETALYYCNYDNLYWFLENDIAYCPHVFITAVKKGYTIDCFEFLLDNEYGLPEPEDILELFAEYKDINKEAIIYLVGRIDLRAGEILDCQFEFKNDENALWLCNQEHMDYLDSATIYHTAIEEECDLEIFDYLWHINCWFKLCYIEDLIAETDNPAITKWFTRHRYWMVHENGKSYIKSHRSSDTDSESGNDTDIEIESDFGDEITNLFDGAAARATSASDLL